MRKDKNFVKGLRYRVSKECYDTFSWIKGLEAGKVYTCIEDGRLHISSDGQYFSEWNDRYFTLVTNHTKGGKLL